MRWTVLTKKAVTWKTDFIITNSTMPPCWPYYILVLAPGKVSQFISFVEEGTDIEHSEDHLGGYWSPTAMEGGAWLTKGSYH